MAALLPVPDRNTAVGRRDYAPLLTLFNTGARVQGLLDLRPCDLQLEPPRQVLLQGKRRKQRVCPLWEDTAAEIRELLRDSGRAETDAERLFRNRRDEPLTRHGVRDLLRKHAAAACSEAKTLATKRVHPHAMRHRRHVSAAGRSGHRDNQPLAGTCQHRDHQPLSGAGSGGEARHC